MRYVLNETLKEYRNKRRTDKTKTKLNETTLIEMFHDPDECHMPDPIFVHRKRWNSVSFKELQ